MSLLKYQRYYFRIRNIAGLVILRLYLMSIRFSKWEFIVVQSNMIGLSKSMDIQMPGRHCRKAEFCTGGPDKALNRLTAVANPAAFPREKLLKIWYYN